MNMLPLLMLGGLAAVFWLLVLRPAKNKQKAQAALVNEAEVGSEIMTTAGVFGTITSIDDDKFQLEIAPGVQITMLKAAISKVIDPVDATEETTDETAIDASEKTVNLSEDATSRSSVDPSSN